MLKELLGLMNQPIYWDPEKIALAREVLMLLHDKLTQEPEETLIKLVEEAEEIKKKLKRPLKKPKPRSFYARYNNLATGDSTEDDQHAEVPKE